MKVLKKNSLGDEEDYKEYAKLLEDSLTQKIDEFKKQNKALWKVKHCKFNANNVI